jgi:hypothetical protein
MDAQRMMAATHMGSVSAFAFLGAFAGFVHLKLLSWNIHALVRQSRRLLSVGASLGRAVVTPAVFALAVFHGALALLAALGGFLLCRAILLRHLELLL